MVNVEGLIHEFEFSAVRSRGPGGQNVNKVSSAAQLFWSFEDSSELTLEQKALIHLHLKNFINRENQIYLRSDEFRDLERNKARCLEKLQFLLNKAFFKPKTRKKTKPSKAAKIKRTESKRRRGETKKLRRKPEY